jgi:hypothetical protein
VFSNTEQLRWAIHNNSNNNNNNNNNKQVQTDRTIPNNKPDIIIRDNEKRTCMLIDVAISEERNVIKKTVKILKYKDFTIEVQRMWNVKTKAIPVIIGATGTISKTFRKYVNNIPENQEVKELQKTAILGTAHILRKVLTYRYNGVNAGTSDMSTMNSYIKIVATQCFPGTWFVSGI